MAWIEEECSRKPSWLRILFDEVEEKKVVKLAMGWRRGDIKM
jgi:hypothetical protein